MVVSPAEDRLRRVRKSQIYKPKALIDGSKIGQQAGTSWVAIPDKFAGRLLVVEYGHARMTIKDWKRDAAMFRRFRDKFWTAESGRPQHYTLGYFKFVPDVESRSGEIE